MDLSSHKTERRLRYNYVGARIAATQILYVPLRIDHFEIVESWLHPGKECLVMLTVHINKNTGEIINNMVLTESYQLVKDIKGTEGVLPHFTKFRKNKGYIFFTHLTEKEKSQLLNL